MTRALLACAVVCTFPLAALAESPARTAAGTRNEWTVDDVVRTEEAGDFQLAPDCRHVVWVRTAADQDKGERVLHLVRSSLTDKQEVQLTRGPESCTSPRWSPDGKLLAFLSTRTAPKAKPAGDDDEKAAGKEDEPKAQVWLIDPTGGEPWPLTGLKRPVRKIAWAGPDTFLFTALEEPSLYEATAKDEKKDTSVVVEDERHEPPVRLFRVDVHSKKVTRLTDNADRITDLVPSPDGRHAVTIHERSLRYLYDNRVKPAVYLYDLKDGTSRRLFEAPHFHVHRVLWAADGKGFYVVNHFTHSPDYLMTYIAELYYHDLAAGSTTRVDLDWDNGLAAEDDGEEAWGLDLTADGFVALLANGARPRAARYRRAGDRWTREWLTGEHAGRLFGLRCGGDGRTLVYAHAAADSPGQWYRARRDGARLAEAARLTDLNGHLKQKPRARGEVVRWKGARGDEVEGLLYYPHGYEAGKRYPLVVMIHGGPMSADLDAWHDSWAYPVNLMAQRGAFVFKPNYHGSSNYGLAWLESIAGGNYYDLEVPDIEKGVDALIARGLVDPDRLGVLGWSNGAILTIALTVATTRYKAAAAGAGDVEYTSDWGNCEFGAAFDNYYFGKSPLQDARLYAHKSPFYRLDRVRTPTLIFFGTEDRTVPTQQGWMHYRALQQLGKTEVRFVLFPGEKHHLDKLAHQRRKLEEELAWFDRHLFRKAGPEDAVVKAGSPLERLFRLKDARRDGTRYGAPEKGVLVPETVPFEGLHVGRFEVTQAQYAQFDKAYAVEPGRENYPAHGIAFAQARAYCEWLSKATGRSYRLPDETEAETLYAAVGAGENTLDAWAGYAVNPDDAARLRAKLAALGGAATLLKEVGGGKGAGPDGQVFDLGGNVAEWVVGRDGMGRTAGGSADTLADARLRARRPGPEYVGFRVIRGASRPQGR
jgi:dipeptidyl aminopeptidase/acylaminoacyl peptidase